MTQTFNIDPGSQPDATFNCDAITGANGVRYFYGPDKGNVTGYFASTASDPLNRQVVSCTDTQVTVTYTQTEAYKGFTLTLVGARVGTTGDAVLLTEDAIVNSVTGPYHVTTIRTSGATGVTTVSSSSFNFGGAGGGGIQTPKASIVAYIADKTPNRPSGLTADGQNSDANTAPSVSILPGTTKLSLVVKNTGYVDQTGGVVKDSSGHVVANVPALAAGATTVVVIDATVAENAQFTETYSVVMSGPNSDSSPVSDPVNAKGIDVTPEASADTATTDYATPVTIDVLGKDAPGTSTYPLDPSTLTLIDASGNAVSTLTVSGGTYKVVNGKIVFTPAA